MVLMKHDSGRATLGPIALCGVALLAIAVGITLWLSQPDESPTVAPAPVAAAQPAELVAPIFERQAPAPGEARPLAVDPVNSATQAAEAGAALPLAVDESVPPPDFDGRVQGSVRDANALPVAGAQVLLGSRRTATDGEGRFEFREVVPEPSHAISEQLAVRAAGFAVHREMQRLPTEALPVREVEVLLERAGALEGLVTDVRGQRLASVPVRVLFEQTETFGGEAPPRLAACTDVAGQWRIEHVPAGRFLVEAGRETWDTQWPEQPAGPAASDCTGGTEGAPSVIGDVVVTVGRTTRVDFVLHPPGLLSGRVLDSLGGRLAGAVVRLESVTRWPTTLQNTHQISAGADFVLEARNSTGNPVPPTVVFKRRIAQTESDERGEYHFERVPAGELRLSTHLPDRPAARAQLELQLAPGMPVADADLIVPLGLDLRSMLVDRAGLPVPGATVWLEPEGTSVFGGSGSVRSDERGVFEFLGVPPGRRILYVTHPQHASLWVPVEAAELAGSYVLDPALQLRLEVVDDEDDAGVAAFELRVETPSFGLTTAVTDAGGITEVPLDDDRAATVRITAAGYLPAVVKDVIPSHTAQIPLQIRLQRQP